MSNILSNSLVEQLRLIGVNKVKLGVKVHGVNLPIYMPNHQIAISNNFDISHHNILTMHGIRMLYFAESHEQLISKGMILKCVQSLLIEDES